MKTEANIPYKFYLEESELPTAWYNVRADMKNKPAPLLNPGTLKPMTARELGGVFCDELDDTTVCAAPTDWKRPSAPRRRSTINSKATTPAAATS